MRPTCIYCHESADYICSRCLHCEKCEQCVKEGTTEHTASGWYNRFTAKGKELELLANDLHRQGIEKPAQRVPGGKTV